MDKEAHLGCYVLLPVPASCLSKSGVLLALGTALNNSRMCVVLVIGSSCAGIRTGWLSCVWRPSAYDMPKELFDREGQLPGPGLGWGAARVAPGSGHLQNRACQFGFVRFGVGWCCPLTDLLRCGLCLVRCQTNSPACCL